MARAGIPVSVCLAWRPDTADGDANPASVCACLAQAGPFGAWCQERGVKPVTAAEDDIPSHRKHPGGATQALAEVASS